VLQEAGRLSDALEFLQENSAVLPDHLTYLELRADLFFKLGRIADAEKSYMILLERNRDGVDYMKRIEECKSLCKSILKILILNLRLQIYRLLKLACKLFNLIAYKFKILT
jgi:tetratricopeptide (TPR) repeat protein